MPWLLIVRLLLLCELLLLLLCVLLVASARIVARLPTVAADLWPARAALLCRLMRCWIHALLLCMLLLLLLPRACERIVPRLPACSARMMLLLLRASACVVPTLSTRSAGGRDADQHREEDLHAREGMGETRHEAFKRSNTRAGHAFNLKTQPHLQETVHTHHQGQA